MDIKSVSTIVVWFSCGAASAIAAQETIRQYPDCKIRIVNNPVEEEHEDNRRFLKDVEKWLEKEVEVATNSKYPSASAKDVWEKRKYMAGVSGAPCTIELKKEARKEWERYNHADYHVLGFTKDEKGRYDRFTLTERDNVIPVLIDAGLDKQDCYDRLHDAGIEPPLMYALGFPNANCIGCVKSNSPTYWNHVRKHFPEIFRERAEQSRRIGAKLVRVKGERYFLDELDPETMGAPLKSMKVECGIFCEEGDDEQEEPEGNQKSLFPEIAVRGKNG